MMPNLAATKCYSSIGHIRQKKTYKATMGYKLQWHKESIFLQNLPKENIYTEHRSMHSVAEIASRMKYLYIPNKLREQEFMIHT